MTIATANLLSTDSCSVIPRSSESGKSLTSIFNPSMHPSLPMSARTGRTTARYTSGTNRRLCAGVVALSTHSTTDSPGHHTHVLVTSSSRHPDRYVLPKGGWEQDESAEQSALREGWEEDLCLAAGVVGKITKFLAQVVDPRPPNKANANEKKKKHKVNGIIMKEPTTGEEYTPRAEYLYYEVEVDKLASEYPESDERIRKWMSYDEAMEALKWRPEMTEVLRLSQIVKGVAST